MRRGLLPTSPERAPVPPTRGTHGTVTGGTTTTTTTLPSYNTLRPPPRPDSQGSDPSTGPTRVRPVSPWGLKKGPVPHVIQECSVVGIQEPSTPKFVLLRSKFTFNQIPVITRVFNYLYLFSIQGRSIKTSVFAVVRRLLLGFVKIVICDFIYTRCVCTFFSLNLSLLLTKGSKGTRSLTIALCVECRWYQPSRRTVVREVLVC